MTPAIMEPWAPSNVRAAETLAWLEWLLGLGPRPQRRRSEKPRVKSGLTGHRKASTPEERRAYWREYARLRRSDPAVRARENERNRVRLAPTRKAEKPPTPEQIAEREARREARMERDRERNRIAQRERRAAMDRDALRERWRRDTQAYRERQRRAA